MSQAHYEAVRVSSERPYSMNGSRKSFLPLRLRRAPTAPDLKVSRKFSHPKEEGAQQVTHEHVLVLGNRILTQVQLNNERKMQQTYEQMLEAERERMENEYQQRSDEMIRKWEEQLDDEKRRLEKDFEQALVDMERIRQERNKADEQALIRRMKDECDQALAKQWQIANEKLSSAVKQAEDRLHDLLELSHRQDKERFTQELIAKKDAEYAQRELRAIERIKGELTKEYDQNIQVINERHTQEIAALNKKLKSTEERFRREFSSRARLESDFRLLQTDYKRFMDHSNVFHSDYMLKLCHIGEQIGDAKFEQILDRILAESATPETQLPKSKPRVT